ncbi:MAG: iron-siderophore ABC transporter substrate-binding protein [Dehalococcoidia bacterium]
MTPRGRSKLLVAALRGAVLVAVFLGLTLVACGSSDDATSRLSGDVTATPARAATPPMASTAAPAFPVTVTHKLGTAELKAAPRRVVTLSVMDLDAAVALGVTPVATTRDVYNPSGVPIWLSGRIDPGTTTLLPAGTEVPFEQIAALNPDLILATGSFAVEQAFGTLSRIAPTIAYQTLPAGESWQERLHVIGTALGRSQQAAQVIAETEQTIQATKARYPALQGKTFSLSLLYAPGQIATIYSEKDFAVQFFQQLGLIVAPTLATLHPFSATNTSGAVSFEQMALLDADLLIMSYNNDELRRSLEENPLFQSLAAVQQHRYVTVDLETVAALRFPAALNIPWTLQQLTPAFALISP